MACLRPRLTHWPTNAWFSTFGSVPAMRASTVLAACTPSGPAAWQLIRSGWPDGRRRRQPPRCGVVNAGQGFVGEQPAEGVGA
ncbi:hypothetical protein I552_1622 [Mycobacterium xenopi 3993]|nr:hypothetical protein I552_1622 [Mycobacterium xenopi 3993]